jgi:hypothetical protein
MVLSVTVDAPESLTPPPRGATIDVLRLSGSRSQTYGNASQGATMSRTFLKKEDSSPYVVKDLKK